MLDRVDTRNVLIGYASGLGARNPGCGDGPSRLQAAGLDHYLRTRRIQARWSDLLYPDRRPDDALEDTVARLNERLAVTVAQALRAGERPFVVGGDHTCAVGTWRGTHAGLGGQSAFGLLWIDAHMDAHTPESSHTGLLHGMPLAMLMGYCGEGAPRCDAVLRPEHVCIIGARSYEAEEAALLREIGVRIYEMEEIAARGVAAVLREAHAQVRRGAAAYGVSLDVDCIDPEQAPGVGTPAPGGLDAQELIDCLSALAHDDPPVTIEIAEFNPHADRGGSTLHIVEQMAAALAGQADASDAIETENDFGAHNYASLPVVLVRGRGAEVWDRDGNKYLDMLAAYSALNHGHCHPRIVAALDAQAQRLAMTSRAYFNDRLPALLQRLCMMTGMDRALPANTGLEGVEAALKAARKWGYKVKGIAADQAEIITCAGNFHGRSIAIVAFSSEAQYRDGFGPFPAGFRSVAYGDARALEAAITPQTAAFLVEPIQGERGILVPPAGYLAACANICRAHNVLLIADEIQTGLGRTGKFLACEHEDVQPDGLILGKALGGGLLPVSAFLAREEVMNVFTPGDHGSTFGGNPLACAVALEALEVLIDEHLIERAAELGAYFYAALSAIRSPLIKEVRGRGLMIGMELDPARVNARDAVLRLMNRGVLSKDTHDTVLRFTPPLVVEKAQLDWAVTQVREVLTELEATLPAP